LAYTGYFKETLTRRASVSSSVARLIDLDHGNGVVLLDVQPATGRQPVRTQVGLPVAG
jgi:hypothetical protein